MRRRPMFTIAGALAAVTLGACGSATTTGDESSQADDVGAASPAETIDSAPASNGSGPAGPDQPAGDEVPEALAVAAPTVSGGVLDLATFVGQPVALWFWAPT